MIIMERQGMKRDSREMCFVHVTSEDVSEEYFFYFDEFRQATYLMAMLTGLTPDCDEFANWNRARADVKLTGVFVEDGPCMTVHVGIVGGG